MKQSITLGLLSLVIAAGCEKIEAISPQGSSATTTPGASPETDTSPGVSEEDTYKEDSFERSISLTWADGTVTKSGDANNVVTIDGTHVTVDNRTTTEKVIYTLSGTCADGSLKLYSNNKQTLILDGLSLTNPAGAAINNQGKKSCYVIVNGTNSLADSPTAAYTATGEEDLKAVFFSEGQILLSGTGSLSVQALNAQGKSALTSDDYVYLDGPSVTISAGSSAGHGLRGKESVIVSAGTLDISVEAAMKKGITSDSLVVFNGGVTTINVSGGTAQDPEDNNEYKAAAGIKADQVFKMNDGTLTVTATGQGGKAIAGDGAAYFNGGTVVAKAEGTNFGSSSGGGNPGGGGGMPPGGGGRPRATQDNDSSKSAKAIKFDGDIRFTGGSVSAIAVNHEAIEAKGVLTVTGGTIYAQSSDDAINSAYDMTISGGYVCAYSTGNDGLDANGDCKIQGGVVYAVGSRDPEVGIDANTEEHKTLYVTGGTLFVIGGLERGSSLSQTCYTVSSWKTDTWYALTVGSDTYAIKTPSSGGSSLVVSGASKPGLKTGVSVDGGTSIWNGMGALQATVSGGTEVTLK